MRTGTREQQKLGGLASMNATSYAGGMKTQTPFKRLILRAIPRKASPVVIRILAVPDFLDLSRFDEVFRAVLDWDGLGFSFHIHGQEFTTFLRRTRAQPKTLPPASADPDQGTQQRTTRSVPAMVPTVPNPSESCVTPGSCCSPLWTTRNLGPRDRLLRFVGVKRLV